MDTTPFIVEAVVVLFFSVVLLLACFRQVFHDFCHSERWRPLIVSHYLMIIPVILQVVGSIDPQGGLGLYSPALILFFSQVRSCFLLAATRALAAGFVASHQLVTQGPQEVSKSTRLVATHSTFVVVSCVLFIVVCITRNQWSGVVAKSLISFYSIIVGVQIFVSAYNMRQILIDENKRTGKYTEGIRKLTRLLVLVAVLLLIGNISLWVGLVGNIQDAMTTELYPQHATGNFSIFHIVSDFTGVVSLAALIMGGWKLRSDPHKDSRKTTTRSSTPPSPSPVMRGRGNSAQAYRTTGSITSMPSATAVELSRTETTPLEDIEAKPNDIPPAKPIPTDEDANNRKQGDYQELGIV